MVQFKYKGQKPIPLGKSWTSVPFKVPRIFYMALCEDTHRPANGDFRSIQIRKLSALKLRVPPVSFKVNDSCGVQGYLQCLTFELRRL
jgi:hypothetical protein